MKTQTKRKILDAVRRSLRLEPEPTFAPQTIIYPLETETARTCLPLKWHPSTKAMDEWELRAKTAIARRIGEILLREGFVDFYYEGPREGPHGDSVDGGLCGRASVTRPLLHWRDEKQRTWRDTPAGQRVVREGGEFQRREGERG